MTNRFARAASGFLLTAAVLFVARSTAGQDRANPQATEARAADAQVPPIQVLTAALNRWAEIIQPAPGQEPRTLVARIHVVQARGLPAELEGLMAGFASRP
jgi:hypothetical protein